MPTFIKCDESVVSLAAAILCEFESHKPILSARTRIDYVFAYSDKDDQGQPKGDAIRHRGQRALGLCRKIKLKDRVMGRADAEITLDGDWWETATEAERRALLDHELHHINIEMDSNGKSLTDDFSRPKITLRKHDFEFGWFSIIAARHGKASQECKQADFIVDKSGQAFWPEIYGKLDKAA